jgi:hypothetical protein
MIPSDNPILTPLVIQINLSIVIKAVLFLGMGVISGGYDSFSHSQPEPQFVLI